VVRGLGAPAGRVTRCPGDVHVYVNRHKKTPRSPSIASTKRPRLRPSTGVFSFPCFCSNNTRAHLPSQLLTVAKLFWRLGAALRLGTGHVPAEHLILGPDDPPTVVVLLAEKYRLTAYPAVVLHGRPAQVGAELGPVGSGAVLTRLHGQRVPDRLREPGRTDPEHVPI